MRKLRRCGRNGGLSLKDLSEKTGISEATLGKFEAGNALPNLEGLLSICRAMEVTPNDILLDISLDGQKARQSRAEKDAKALSFDEKLQYVLSLKQNGKKVYTALLQRKLGVTYKEAKELMELASE